MKNLNFQTAWMQQASPGSHFSQFLIKRILPCLIIAAIFGGCKKPSTEAAKETANSKKAEAKTTDITGQDYFQIAIIPDTQFYTAGTNGGNMGFFDGQISWIINNLDAEKIAYVTQLGDLVNNGNFSTQWVKARDAMYRLENAVSPNYPEGVPYGISVGNHDQYPLGKPGSAQTTLYNQYFGRAHFISRTYFGNNYLGGASGANNNSHFDYFRANGIYYTVFYVEYSNNSDYSGVDVNTAVCNWIETELDANPTRKSIIVSHSMLGSNPVSGTNYGLQADWHGPDPAGAGPGVSQGLRIYNAMKSHKNVVLMLCGHVGGEGYRQDVYDGHTIKTYLSDYQSRVNGGNGLMRLLKINTKTDKIDVRTFRVNATGGVVADETDGDSKFSRPLFKEQTRTRYCDFSGNGISEGTLFANGTWKFVGPNSSDISTAVYGLANDIPVPADYNGDGKIERSVFRRTTNKSKWYISGMTADSLGLPTDIPVPEDFDGNGSTDMAVFRPSNSNWIFTNGTPTVVFPSTTIANAIPVPGDYNGDGKAEPAIVTSTFLWKVSGMTDVQFGGVAGDVPVPGDYDGDGKTDIATFNKTTGAWKFYLNVIPNVASYGGPGDIPIPGDYDGDGKTDPAIYRPADKKMHVRLSNGSGMVSVVLDLAGSKVVNLPYPIRNVYFP